jgi:hypothetical protein
LAAATRGHFTLGRGNYALEIGGQEIQRTLIVKESVEACEPERQRPTIIPSPNTLRISAISLRGR